jgi:hypothetical protein
MKKPIQIYADFMKMDDNGRLVLVCRGTFKDLEENNIELDEGMKLTFYNEDEDNNGNRDDLVVKGIIEYDKEKERWTAKINWDEIRNISQLSSNEKKNLGIQ